MVSVGCVLSRPLSLQAVCVCLASALFVCVESFMAVISEAQRQNNNVLHSTDFTMQGQCGLLAQMSPQCYTGEAYWLIHSGSLHCIHCIIQP